jgi:hypothetical protein
MDGPTLQARIYEGYARAAARIGLPCSQYRPTNALAPAIAASNLLRTLTASFNAKDFAYGKAQDFGKATWYCLADGTQTAPGDYLVRPDGVPFFIAAQQPLLPILAVECNRVVNVLRPQQQQGVGAQGYGGDTVALETPLVTGYPASVLVGTKSDRALVNLPGDVRNPAWNVLLPDLPNDVFLRIEDVITDDQAKRYVISSAELSELGWRINAVQAET